MQHRVRVQAASSGILGSQLPSCRKQCRENLKPASSIWNGIVRNFWTCFLYHTVNAFRETCVFVRNHERASYCSVQYT